MSLYHAFWEKKSELQNVKSQLPFFIYILQFKSLGSVIYFFFNSEKLRLITEIKINFFLKKLIILGCIKLIKSNGNNIYNVTKDFK